MNDIIKKLLNSDEPSIRFKVLNNVLGKELESTEILKLQNEIKSSPRVKLLLSERDKDGKIPFHPYRKWYGAHWVLASLADIGYPSKDESLVPLRKQVYEWLSSKEHEKKIISIKGRVRRCASQEGNALYYLLSLGLADARTDELAERLMKWQWSDGGWNCDKNPEAINSSFMESLIPLRGLALYGKITGNKKAKKAAERAAEIFLKRKISEIKPTKRWRKEDFIKLHYPCYWHYDILFGLKVMAEAGFIEDQRCYDALELLESKRLPDGGFPAEKRFYQVTEKKKSGYSLVDWEGASKRHMNEFVTADALYVLKESGRLNT
ncbi:MAG: hypothetical protein KAW88_04840 [Candidatus Cloacimonetes bacterium]|nr:hypothetical protein [Candidatus Cloacimonadota bacterium]